MCITFSPESGPHLIILMVNFFSTQSFLEKRSTYFYFHINIMPSKF